MESLLLFSLQLLNHPYSLLSILHFPSFLPPSPTSLLFPVTFLLPYISLALLHTLLWLLHFLLSSLLMYHITSSPAFHYSSSLLMIPIPFYPPSSFLLCLSVPYSFLILIFLASLPLSSFPPSSFFKFQLASSLFLPFPSSISFYLIFPL